MLMLHTIDTSYLEIKRNLDEMEKMKKKTKDSRDEKAQARKSKNSKCINSTRIKPRNT